MLEPICDEIGEISCIKIFDTIFDNEKYRDFYNLQMIREEINQKYSGLILGLNKSKTKGKKILIP